MHRSKKKTKTKTWMCRCAIQMVPKYLFDKDYFYQLILLFSLFLLLFMGLTALFGIIHGSHCTISANFYFYLQYFQ